MRCGSMKVEKGRTWLCVAGVWWVYVWWMDGWVRLRIEDWRLRERRDLDLRNGENLKILPKLLDSVPRRGKSTTFSLLTVELMDGFNEVIFCRLWKGSECSEGMEWMNMHMHRDLRKERLRTLHEQGTDTGILTSANVQIVPGSSCGKGNRENSEKIWVLEDSIEITFACLSSSPLPQSWFKVEKNRRKNREKTFRLWVYLYCIAL